MKATILYKLNQIARLRLFSGLKDFQVAQLIGLSQGGLSRIIALPEYQEMEAALLETGITKLDEAVAGKAEEMKKLFAPAVPAAMRTLMETVTQRRDLRAAVAASIEVLDRDPEHTFSKASRNAIGESPQHQVPSGVLSQAIAATTSVANAVAAGAKVIQPPDKNVN